MCWPFKWPTSTTPFVIKVNVKSFTNNAHSVLEPHPVESKCLLVGVLEERNRFIHSYYCACSSHLSYNKIYLKLTIVVNIKSGETFWTPCIAVANLGHGLQVA